MLENLQRELDRLPRLQKVETPLEADAEGYADNKCSAEACLFQFKILAENWTNLVRDKDVFYPSCKHAVPAKSWYTTEQIEASMQYARGIVVQEPVRLPGCRQEGADVM